MLLQGPLTDLGDLSIIDLNLVVDTECPVLRMSLVSSPASADNIEAESASSANGRTRKDCMTRQQMKRYCTLIIAGKGDYMVVEKAQLFGLD
jgi:hypothetical protein